LDGGFDAAGEDHPSAGLTQFGVFEAIAKGFAVGGELNQAEPALGGPKAGGGRSGFEDSLVSETAADTLGLECEGLGKWAKGDAFAARRLAGCRSWDIRRRGHVGLARSVRQGKQGWGERGRGPVAGVRILRKGDGRRVGRGWGYGLDGCAGLLREELTDELTEVVQE
jgi:hypothetical protein